MCKIHTVYVYLPETVYEIVHVHASSVITYSFNSGISYETAELEDVQV